MIDYEIFIYYTLYNRWFWRLSYYVHKYSGLSLFREKYVLLYGTLDIIDSL